MNNDAPAQRLALVGLFVLALLYTAYLARPVLLPVALAVLLSLALLPAVNRLASLGVPRRVGAALAMAAAVAVTSAGALGLAEPASAWLARAPGDVEELRYKLGGVRRSVAQVSEAAKQVEEITRAVAPPVPATKLAVAPPSLAERVLSETPGVAATFVAVLVLAYFLLASGDAFLRKVVGAAPGFSAKRRTVIMACALQREVAGYLFAVACINAGLGAATAALLYLAGYPNPVLWGVMAGILNFVPYLGPAVSFTVIATVGVLSFDEPFRMLLGPMLFAALAFVEGSILAPLRMARRFRLDPVVIVLATMLWGWMWGIAGALIAVPMLVTLRIVGAHLRPFAPLAAAIGGSDAAPVARVAGEPPPAHAGYQGILPKRRSSA